MTFLAFYFAILCLVLIRQRRDLVRRHLNTLEDSVYWGRQCNVWRRKFESEHEALRFIDREHQRREER